MFDLLFGYLETIWESLKKIWRAIVKFFDHIASFFRSKHKEVIQKHPKAKAISIKIEKELKTNNYNNVDLGLNEMLEGNYAIVNTYFDEETGEILEEHTEVEESDRLDRETLKQFGDKDMLVLN